MDLRSALEGQYRAGLTMLRECIEKCPDDLWAAGKHPRTTWRIAYHTLFYTHLYLAPTYEDFEPWAKHQAQGRILWDDDEDGVPPDETTYTQAEMLEYQKHVEDNLSGWLGKINLESDNSGFDWYPIPKIDHQLVNIRHLGTHIGQLQEQLYARGIDLDWVSRR